MSFWLRLSGLVLMGGSLCLVAIPLWAGEGDLSPPVFLGVVEPHPEHSTTVTAPLWGKIYLERGIFSGTKVRQGQKLATIILELNAAERLPLDQRTVEIEEYLEVARQRLRVALNDYQRALKIFNSNPEFQDEVERRKRIYENALEEYQLTSQQRMTQQRVVQSRDPKIVEITAPLDGYITEVHFVPGEINPTDEFRRLFTLVDLSSVYVRIEVYEKDLPLFAGGPPVRIRSEAYPEEVFRGFFRSVGSQVDPESRSIPVFYEVSNPGEKLRIGLRVRVELEANGP